MRIVAPVSEGGNMKMSSALKSVGLLAGLLFLVSACAPSNPSSVQGTDSSNIVNGTPVLGENNPIAMSTVDLYYTSPTQGSIQNLCTGVIIGEDTILTAAHCFVDASVALHTTVDQLVQQLQVGFGTSIITNPSDTRVQMIKLLKVTVNPDYVMGKLDEAQNGAPLYDMAVIKMVSPIPAGYKVVKMLDHADVLQVGTQLTLAGFGLTRGGFFGTPAKQLMQTDVTIDNPTINPTQFHYTTQNGKTACSGDSGGPAYLRDADGTLELAGVTSWGDGGCTQFGVYTSVPAMYSWILSAQAN